MPNDNSALIADVLEKTDPELARDIDAKNSWQEAIIIRGARVNKYRLYERGNHAANMTSQMKKMLRISADAAEQNEFNDNYMKIVIDKMAGRLHVSNISTDTDDADEWVNEILEMNDWEALEGELYRGATRDADSYVLIDPVTLRWMAEPAYDGFSGIVAIFDMTGKPIWAAKLWSEADSEDLTGDDDQTTSVVMKLIVYQPTQISFWRSREGAAGAEPVNQVVDEPVADVETTNFVAWELGELPLIHLVNQKDNYTPYGESELRPAIPLQDTLNRTLHSMAMTSDFSAFPLLWCIGMELDVNGITPGAVLNLVLQDQGGTTADLTVEQIEFLKAVRIGRFEGADMAQYTNQIDKLVKEISQVTQTPIYGITVTGNVSGDALKQLEIGLIGKIKRFQRENTVAIRSLIFLTAKMQTTFNTELGKDAPAFESVNVEWQSPEILDAGAQIIVLSTLRKDSPNLWPDKWYRDQIGALLGMAQEEIDLQGEEVENRRALNIASLTASGTGAIPVA